MKTRSLALPTPKDWYIATAIFLAALACYLPFLGAFPLLDWDELIYGEAAREMLESGNFLQVYVNYNPFWEKPPLYFWLQALSFHFFGVSEASARLPSSVFVALTVGLVFLVGKTLHHQNFGFLWCGLLGTALLPVFYGKYGIIDPVFNFFVINALLGLFLREATGQWLWGLGAAIALGLAVTAKGPLALVLVFGIFGIYKLWQREPWPSIGGVVIFVVGSLALASSWFVVETLSHGPWFIESFIQYQRRISGSNDGHPGPIYYHLMVFLAGCFPFAPFVFGGGRVATTGDLARFHKLALVWFVLILGLFSLVVQTKLPHYASLLYVPGSFLAALRLNYLSEKGLRAHPLELGLLGLTGVLISAVVLLIVWVGQDVSVLYPYLSTDPLAMAYIHLPVTWPWWTSLAGIWIILAVVGGIWLMLKLHYRPALILLGGLSVLTMNSFWLSHIQRFATYAQGDSITLIQKARTRPEALAFYGPKSFVPPFYSQRQVHNPANEGELLAVLQDHPQLIMLIREVDLERVGQIMALQRLEQSGPFWLVKIADGGVPEASPPAGPSNPSSTPKPLPLAPSASPNPPKS